MRTAAGRVCDTGMGKGIHSASGNSGGCMLGGGARRALGSALVASFVLLGDVSTAIPY